MGMIVVGYHAGTWADGLTTLSQNEQVISSALRLWCKLLRLWLGTMVQSIASGTGGTGGTGRRQRARAIEALAEAKKSLLYGTSVRRYLIKACALLAMARC